MVQACLPVVVDVLFGVMLAKPATDRLGGGKWVLLRFFKVFLPLLSVLETIFLSTRGTFESISIDVSD